MSPVSRSRKRTSKPSRRNPSRYWRNCHVCPPTCGFWASDPATTIVSAIDTDAVIEGYVAVARPRQEHRVEQRAAPPAKPRVAARRVRPALVEQRLGRLLAEGE